MIYRSGINRCSKCGQVCREGQRYCNKHHAEYMVKWRKTHVYVLCETKTRRGVKRGFVER